MIVFCVTSAPMKLYAQEMENNPISMKAEEQPPGHHCYQGSFPSASRPYRRPSMRGRRGSQRVVELLEERVVVSTGLGTTQRLDPLDADLTLSGEVARMFMTSAMKSFSGMAIGSFACLCPVSSVCT